MHIVVIGAGSIGSHIAYRLAKEGADVTVVDAGDPGQGTSAVSFAWLSSFPQVTWTEEPGRAKLRLGVHDVYRELEAELATDTVSWTGTLTVAEAHEAEDLMQRAEVARTKGIDVVHLTPDQVREIEPHLELNADQIAFLESGSGWVDAPRLIRTLLTRAQGLGARVLSKTAVAAIETSAERVRAVHTTLGERIGADAVVNCAGSWGTHVAALAGLTIPLQLLPGRIITTEPLPKRVTPQHIISTPSWQIRPAPGGRLALNGRGSAAAGEAVNIGRSGDLAAGVAQYLPALRDLPIATSRIGIRPVPPGGPIVGALPWLPNFYSVLSHGGIGWAPVWAQFTARELLAGEVVEELAAMRPDRFHRSPGQFGRYADDAEQTLP